MEISLARCLEQVDGICALYSKSDVAVLNQFLHLLLKNLCELHASLADEPVLLGSDVRVFADSTKATAPHAGGTARLRLEKEKHFTCALFTSLGVDKLGFKAERDCKSNRPDGVMYVFRGGPPSPTG